MRGNGSVYDDIFNMTLPSELNDAPPVVKQFVKHLVQRVEFLNNKLAAYEMRRTPANTEFGQEVFEFAEVSATSARRSAC